MGSPERLPELESGLWGGETGGEDADASRDGPGSGWSSRKSSGCESCSPGAGEGGVYSDVISVPLKLESINAVEI